MKTYKWVNTFHGTSAISTLNEEEAIDIDIMYYTGYINSRDNRYRKLKALDNKLCPFKRSGCSCVVGRVVVD